MKTKNLVIGILSIILFNVSLFSVANANIVVISSSERTLEVGVSLPDIEFVESEYSDGNIYSTLKISGAGKLVGKPDVPGFGSWILIPNGTTVSISTSPGEPVVYEEVNLPPVQPPPRNLKGEIESPFTKDEVIFSTDLDYPGIIAKTEPIIKKRGQYCTILWIYPFQFNPVQKRLTVYPNLKVTVNFTGTINPIPSNLKNENLLRNLKRMAINAEAVLSAEENAIYYTNIYILIQQPIQGEPAIVGFPPVIPEDNVTIKLSVDDEIGKGFVSGLVQGDFTISFGSEPAPISNFEEYTAEEYYLIEVEPPTQDEIGLYNLTVNVDHNGNVGSATEFAAILYTHQPLIEKGLAWLKEKQNSDGSWDYNYQSHNVGITALALQAFLGIGYSVDSEVYDEVVENAINFILNNQKPDGAFYNYSSHLMYENCMSIVALTSALKTDLPDDLELQIENALPGALDYITDDVQESWERVSWRYHSGYTSQDDGDMSVNQWVYLVLDAMDYTEKDIWNKIYAYMDYHKGTSGNKAWLGYQDPSSRPRGNTMAATWGLNIAANHSVNGASTLADQCYNYITDGYTVHSLISASNLHNDCVYEGGGYYYYIYEFAKAFALGGKTHINGENWYEILFSRLDGQHQEDGDTYYWTTGFTDPSGYYILPSGLGNHGNTAMALLALQVGTVPPDSKFIIRLGPGGAILVLSVIDGDGNFAGLNENGEWITEIPNSQWISTGDVKELEVELTASEVFTILIHNTGDETGDYNLDLEAYIGDNIADEDNYSGTLEPEQTYGTNANVNAIGGLGVYSSPPVVYPQMELSLTEKTFYAYEPNMVFEFEFEVMETGGDTTVYDIDIFADDLEDGQGNVIDGNNFVFNPSNIASIPPNGSQIVSCTFTIPLNAVLDNIYTGEVYAESNTGTKSFDVMVTPVTITPGNILQQGWNMVSVPYIPDPSDPESIFGDDIIPFYTFNNYSNIYWYDETNLCNVVPYYEIYNGYGYWLKSWEDSVEVDAEGDSVTEDVTLNLSHSGQYYWQGGWHMIGNPFLTYLPFSSCILNNIDNFYYRWDNTVGYQVYPGALSGVFGTWQAFWVHAQSDDASIVMPYSAKCNYAKKKPTQKTDETNWNVRFAVNINNCQDRYNYAGIDDNALNGYDANDLPELTPPNDDYVTLFFPHPEWDYYKANYTKDIRNSDLSDNEWDFVVETNQSGEAVLSWFGVEDAQNSLLLKDMETNTVIDMNEQSEYVFNTQGVKGKDNSFGSVVYNSDGQKDGSYHFKFIVVNTGVEPGIPEIPTNYGLSANYPNPFNPRTVIKYQLPKADNVKISVYNIKGQLIKRLVDEKKEAGYHNVIWDGTDAEGRLVGSGIYLYRIECDEYNASRKMILLK